jgi:hypothetical protein
MRNKYKIKIFGVNIIAASSEIISVLGINLCEAIKKNKIFSLSLFSRINFSHKLKRIIIENKRKLIKIKRGKKNYARINLSG